MHCTIALAIQSYSSNCSLCYMLEFQNKECIMIAPTNDHLSITANLKLLTRMLPIELKKVYQVYMLKLPSSAQNLFNYITRICHYTIYC